MCDWDIDLETPINNFQKRNTNQIQKGKKTRQLLIDDNFENKSCHMMIKKGSSGDLENISKQSVDGTISFDLDFYEDGLGGDTSMTCEVIHESRQTTLQPSLSIHKSI